MNILSWARFLLFGRHFTSDGNIHSFSCKGQFLKPRWGHWRNKPKWQFLLNSLSRRLKTSSSSISCRESGPYSCCKICLFFFLGWRCLWLLLYLLPNRLRSDFLHLWLLFFLDLFILLHLLKEPLTLFMNTALFSRAFANIFLLCWWNTSFHWWGLFYRRSFPWWWSCFWLLNFSWRSRPKHSRKDSILLLWFCLFCWFDILNSSHFFNFTFFFFEITLST